MNTYDQIVKKQIEWAKNRGLELIGSEIDRGRKSYTKELVNNLFRKRLSDETEKEIKNGDGGELNGNPARMQALHSSSAIGVNVFEYWRFQNNLAPILDACKLTQSNSKIAGEINFEAKLTIKKQFNKAPNLDVIIKPNSHSYKAYAIECKFTEPFSTYEHSGVKEVYFEDEDIWSNLNQIKKLADKISPNDKEFHHLHAAQLIKHILGLNQQYGHGKYRLLYLWYDVYGEDGCNHRKEIEKFKEIVDQDGIKFSSITYQELILRLAEHRNEHLEYISYLTERYL